MAFQAKKFGGASDEKRPFHTCVVCGVTDLSHPDMDFRYCPDCADSAGYCTEHIRAHQHRVSAES
jgi:hypothetical protein